VAKMLEGTNLAVCTSGGFKRPSPRRAGAHHVVDLRTGQSPKALTSFTVAAPTTMMADAVATAALLMGPKRGIDWIRDLGLWGLAIPPDGTALMTESPAGLLSTPGADGFRLQVF